MPFPIIPILALVGVAAATVAIVADAAKEEEKHRKKVAELKRKAVQRKGKEDRARLRVDAEHEEWLIARDHLRKLISYAKRERESIKSGLSILKEERQKFRTALKKIKDVKQRRSIRDALYEYDDVVEGKYADAYRYTAFIDQASKLKDDLYGSSQNSRKRIKAARRFDMESGFETGDVPIRGRVVTGVARKPKSGLWFQLDCSIRGHLVEIEESGRVDFEKNQRVGLFVESVDYFDGFARVSVLKARFLEALQAGQVVWGGQIKERNRGGVVVDVGGVECFVPKSKIPRQLNTQHGSIVRVELAEVDPRLRTIVGGLLRTSDRRRAFHLDKDFQREAVTPPPPPLPSPTR